jgi:hypothetical protein
MLQEILGSLPGFTVVSVVALVLLMGRVER